MFAQALERVIGTPVGERPLRMIPGMDFGLRALTYGAAAVHRDVMAAMGFADRDGAKAATD